MDIFLSKFLPTLLYPLGLASLLLLAALLLRKKRRLAIWLSIAALLAVFLGGNRWVASALARSLESRYPPLAAVPDVDVIVVLGGGTESGDLPRQFPEVNGAGDRVLYAYRLFQQDQSRVLFLSGGSINWMDEGASSPAEDMAQILDSLGVPSEAMWLEDRSQNTEENAAFAWNILSEKGITRILLVTSAMHIPRSVQLFESQGFEVIPAPVDYAVSDDRWQALWHPDFRNLLVDLLPNASSLNLTTNALKEYFGMAVNALTGK